MHHLPVSRALALSLALAAAGAAQAATLTIAQPADIRSTNPGVNRDNTTEDVYKRQIQGCLLFVGVIYVIVNLLIDLCYPIFDPRVTAE